MRWVKPMVRLGPIPRATTIIMMLRQLRWWLQVESLRIGGLCWRLHYDRKNNLMGSYGRTGIYKKPTFWFSKCNTNSTIIFSTPFLSTPSLFYTISTYILIYHLYSQLVDIGLAFIFFVIDRCEPEDSL